MAINSCIKCLYMAESSSLLHPAELPQYGAQISHVHTALMKR